MKNINKAIDKIEKLMNSPEDSYRGAIYKGDFNRVTKGMSKKSKDKIIQMCGIEFIK